MKLHWYSAASNGILLVCPDPHPSHLLDARLGTCLLSESLNSPSREHVCDWNTICYYTYRSNFLSMALLRYRESTDWKVETAHICLPLALVEHVVPLYPANVVRDYAKRTGDGTFSPHLEHIFYLSAGLYSHVRTYNRQAGKRRGFEISPRTLLTTEGSITRNERL